MGRHADHRNRGAPPRLPLWSDFAGRNVAQPKVRSWLMVKQKGPTADDRATAAGVALSGIAGGLELGEIAARLAPLHPKNNTFPGEVLLELAADAIEESGASREQPLEFEGIRKRHLPEDRAHTRAQHHKAEYALRAAAMVRAGVDPGLLDEVSWWRTDDLWFWALQALATYVRAAAEHGGETVPAICGRIASRHRVRLAAVT
jgi:hypothetical protein